jgi:hypothetical protein
VAQKQQPETKSRVSIPSEIDKSILPQAYGTGNLMLLARDPHCLYAHWDLTPEQQRQYMALSKGRLSLRIYHDNAAGPLAVQMTLTPEICDKFVGVPTADAKYVAQLGYESATQEWVAISNSGPAFTPPEKRSEDESVKFASVASLFSEEPSKVAEAETSRTPPRVSWIPSLALEPTGTHGQVAEPVILTGQAAASEGNAGAFVSEWTLEQEEAFRKILDREEADKSALSSLNFAVR